MKWIRGDERGNGGDEQKDRRSGRRGDVRLCSITKCIQHHSPTMEETEIEKGKSESAHLGKTSQWRQSISYSVLLKRAQGKYSTAQHKRS